MLNTTMPCDVECMIQIPSDAAGLGTALAVLGLPLWLSWQRPACNVETWVQSLGWEGSLEKEKATLSNIQAWKIPWGRKESDTTERL